MPHRTGRSHWSWFATWCLRRWTGRWWTHYLDTLCPPPAWPPPSYWKGRNQLGWQLRPPLSVQLLELTSPVGVLSSDPSESWSGKIPFLYIEHFANIIQKIKFSVLLNQLCESNIYGQTVEHLNALIWKKRIFPRQGSVGLCGCVFVCVCFCVLVVFFLQSLCHFILTWSSKDITHRLNQSSFSAFRSAHPVSQNRL